MDKDVQQQVPEMWIQTTHRCQPASCGYCYLQNPEVQASIAEALAVDDVQASVDIRFDGNPSFLTGPQLIGIITGYHEHYGNGGRLVLSGGEPLTRSDIGDVLRAVESTGLPALLGTNAALITDSIAGLIIETGIESLQVKVDGPEFIQDFLSGRGFFERMVKGIGRVLSVRGEGSKPFVMGNCVLCKPNLPYAEQVIQNAIDIGLNAIHFQLLFPGNQSFYDWARLDVVDIPALYQLLELVNHYRQYIETDPEQYILAIIKKLELAKRPYTSCGAGERFFFVDPVGRVFICPYAWVSGGNLTQHSVSEIKFPEVSAGNMEECDNCLSTADIWHSREFLPDDIR